MFPIVQNPGKTCVRYNGGWWKVTVLLDGDVMAITCPSHRSEAEAKAWIACWFPNCEDYISSADMIAEIEHRRSTSKASRTYPSTIETFEEQQHNA